MGTPANDNNPVGSGKARLPDTGPFTGDEGCEFRVPVARFKKGYLELPEHFVRYVDSTLAMEPLRFSDPVLKKEFVAECFPQTKLLGKLGEWYRDHTPALDDTIIIKSVNRSSRLYEIRLDRVNMTLAEGGLYLGKEYNLVGSRRYEASKDYWMPLEALLTHTFICGVTGSGKTVLGKSIIEEAARQGVPSILIDLKGDLSSLALLFTSSGELEEWVESRDGAGRKAEAEKAFKEHYARLSEFQIAVEEVRAFKESVDIRIFTPRSKKGIPIGFASPLAAPPNAVQLHKDDKQLFDNLVASLTSAFIDRLYPGVKKSRIENETTFIYEIVHHCWLEGVDLSGEEGLLRLLGLIESPPFEKIGGLSVSRYIDAENRRNRLLNKVNTMLSGAEKLWFEGQPLSMDLFIGGAVGRPRINIINLTELEHFEDKSFVVAQIAYEINKWMRRLPGTTRPRLLFFIDEIGGGGGKQALFPSAPYTCAAKWGLNYLVRQGRSFGVCCLLATQNPGDVDYKGLSNCHTWIIGKLATERDRKKVMEGMELGAASADRIRHIIANLEVGAFVVKDANGKLPCIKERWLMSYHRVLTMSEVSRLMQSSVK